ncbi:MFS transporter [Candidatus Woesearchaeota archaeon]|nr:MFS transporter [Candidatus Woesearchaeota archaeon]
MREKNPKRKSKKQSGRDAKWRKNLRLYYAFRVLCSMNFVMPMFILFLMDKGLSTFEIMVTQAVYTLTELVLTVPSGAFADKVGRKKTLLISSALYASAYVIYAYSGTFTQILFAEVVFALSSAAFHGTGEAFLYDTLAAAKREKQYQRVLGTAYAIQAFVMGGAAVVGGYLAAHDLALPFQLSALPAALSLVPLMFLDEPARVKPSDLSYWSHMKQAAVFAGCHREIRNILYFVSVMSVAGFVGFMLYQPLLTGLGMRLEYLGFAMMALSVANGLGNKVAHRVAKAFGRFDLKLILVVPKALLYLLVWFASGYYLLVWAFLIDLVSGFTAPMVSDWLNRYSRSDNRATVNSLSVLSSSMSFGLLSPLFGLFVDAYSARAAYLLLAVMLGAYALRQLAVMAFARFAARAQKG